MGWLLAVLILDRQVINLQLRRNCQPILECLSALRRDIGCEPNADGIDPYI